MRIAQELLNIMVLSEKVDLGIFYKTILLLKLIDTPEGYQIMLLTGLEELD
jgi:hypothetical protein